jgi:hypothetical protein
MTLSVLLLTLAFVAVAALLLNLNLATRHSGKVKSAAILLVTALYGVAWFGYRGITGWATPEPLPEDFRVYWLMVEDPDKVSSKPGAIYFWVRELDEAGFPVGPPRAHRVAWSESAARAAEAARASMEAGELLNGRLSRNAMAPEDSDQPISEFAGDGGAPGSPQPGFEFSRVPPPALPPKSSADLDGD